MTHPQLDSLKCDLATSQPMQLLLVGASEGEAQQLCHQLQQQFTATQAVKVRQAASTADALMQLDSQHFDIALLSIADVRLNVAHEWSALGSPPALPMLALLAGDESEQVLAALNAGALDAISWTELHKQWLPRLLRHALERHKLIKRVQQAQQREHFLATHDGLTQLPNRRQLASALEAAVGMAHAGNQPMALLKVDLDRFSHINRVLGESTGDAVLISIGRQLAAVIRAGDFVARTGDDAFSILLNPIADTETATGVAQRILEAVAQLREVNGCEIYISASVGVAMFGSAYHVADPHIWQQAADKALCAAKASGGNRYRVALPPKSLAVMGPAPGHDFAAALQARQFVLHYQPIFDAQDHSVAAVEVLLRWQHPQQGLLYPVDFIAQAENDGFIVPMGYWVIAEAARQLKQWRAVPGRQGMRISINLSASQYQDKHLVKVIEAVLMDNDLPADALQFELNEGCLLGDINLVSASLAKLKHAGVRVALDNFGVGLNSLAQLKRLPVDAVKLGRDIVSGVADEAIDDRIASAVRDICQCLGLTMIAEGVESASQQQALDSLGCGYLQGFHLSQPKSAEQLLPELI